MRTNGLPARGRRTRVALAALSGALVLGLTGCSASGPVSAAEPSGAVGTRAATVPSPSTAARATSGGSPATPSKVAAPDLAELLARVSAASKAKGTARMASTTSGSGGVGDRASGVLRFRGSGADFSTTLNEDGSRLTLRFVGGVVYVNFGKKFQGRSWVRIAPGGSDPLSKALTPTIAKLSSSLDVEQQLAAAEGTTITRVVRTRLAGVPVTRYTLVADEEAFRAQLSKRENSPELLAETLTAFEGAHSETDLWIGAGDLPLRVDTRVLGGSLTATSRVTYSDWGAPVRIAVPPRWDVLDTTR